VAILRARATFPILCVEADPRFFRLLEVNARQFPHVSLVAAYLGDDDREVGARLVSRQGTARLTDDASPAGPGEALRTRSLAGLLDEFPDFATAKLLKIDTDGYDNKIIRGAARYLARARPVIFFEYDPYFLSLQNDDGVSVFTMLRDLGYRHMLVYDNRGPLHRVAPLDDDTAVADVHRWAGRAPGSEYADLCVFHAEDADLFETLRQSEAAATAGAGA
jgi:FkbM family methyltransferase